MTLVGATDVRPVAASCPLRIPTHEAGQCKSRPALRHRHNFLLKQVCKSAQLFFYIVCPVGVFQRNLLPLDQLQAYLKEGFSTDYTDYTDFQLREHGVRVPGSWLRS